MEESIDVAYEFNNKIMRQNVLMEYNHKADVHNKKLLRKACNSDDEICTRDNEASNLFVPLKICETRNNEVNLSSDVGHNVKRPLSQRYHNKRPTSNNGTDSVLPFVQFEDKPASKRKNVKVFEGVDTLPSTMNFAPHTPMKENSLNRYSVFPSIRKTNSLLNPYTQYDDKQPVRKRGTNVIISETSFLPTQLPKFGLTCEEKRRIKNFTAKSEDIRKMIFHGIRKSSVPINIEKTLKDFSALPSRLHYPTKRPKKLSTSIYTSLPSIRKSSRFQYNERKPVRIRGSDVILSNTCFIAKPGPKQKSVKLLPKLVTKPVKGDYDPRKPARRRGGLQPFDYEKALKYGVKLAEDENIKARKKKIRNDAHIIPSLDM